MRPVRWEKLGAWGVRLTPPPVTASGIQKEMDVTLSPAGTPVRVLHRLTRLGATPHVVAPWALTVMAAGRVGDPAAARHWESIRATLLPNRRMVIWPYTDLSDPRYRLGRKYFILRQDPACSGPTKIGLAQNPGWAAYFLRDTLFVKTFHWQPGAGLPGRRLQP